MDRGSSPSLVDRDRDRNRDMHHFGNFFYDFVGFLNGWRGEMGEGEGGRDGV